MAKLTKKQKAEAAAVDATKLYGVDEAIGLVKSLASTKFDETVEVAINLGVDPRHADQMVRGVVTLPSGTGKTVRVGVFARGAKADEATAAGADVVGAEDLMELVQGGTIEFDRCIATPDMMGLVGRLGKILGPKGLMPNPKLGTVTMNVGAAVQAAKGGQVEFRVEKAGIIHGGIGKGVVCGGGSQVQFRCVRGRDRQGQADRGQGQVCEQDRFELHHGAGREGGCGGGGGERLS